MNIDDFCVFQLLTALRYGSAVRVLSLFSTQSIENSSALVAFMFSLLWHFSLLCSWSVQNNPVRMWFHSVVFVSKFPCNFRKPNHRSVKQVHLINFPYLILPLFVSFLDVRLLRRSHTFSFSSLVAFPDLKKTWRQKVRQMQSFKVNSQHKWMFAKSVEIIYDLNFPSWCF